jgi:hypothetical protein
MTWDPGAAVQYAKAHKFGSTHHECATHVRKAILAGGIRLRIIHDAKDYGDGLTDEGFYPVAAGSTPRKGDVAVIQPYSGGNPSGHMTIFDGRKWYSDFEQIDIWGGPGYRTNKPAYVIYRKDP